MVVSLAAFTLAAGCGSEIGDSCSISTDCSTAGDRFCAVGADLPNGYCTIIGCDFDTCPEESVCVRFFAVGETGKDCTSQDECGVEEFCTVGNNCVPRTAEVRYCMRKCSSNGDCRSGYECRQKEQMMLHGGEPVPEPGSTLDNDPQAFCAVAPSDVE